MKRLRKWAAEAWLSAFFWHTAHAMWVPQALTGFFTRGTFRCSRAIREATLANARRVLGPAAPPEQHQALARAVLANFYEAVLDFGRNRRRTMEETLADIESVEGAEHYDRARSRDPANGGLGGRGAILVTAHLGPFETAVASLRTREPRVHVVFQRDNLRAFEKLRIEQRRRLGVIEAPVDAGLPTWFALRDALARDEVVLMQGDRTMPGQKGTLVPFLHGHVEIPDGPAKLALLSGAPIVPTFAVKTPSGRVRIIIEEPFLVSHNGPPHLAPRHATERLGTIIAGLVRQYPEQWLNFHPAWIEDQTATASHSE